MTYFGMPFGMWILFAGSFQKQELNPIDVAGCPPDAFSADGQLWGNPLFRWDAMKKDGYSWWTKRVKAMSKLYKKEYDLWRKKFLRGLLFTYIRN